MTSLSPSVYLGGPITGLTYDDGNEWRTFAREWLQPWGIQAFSPLRAKEYLRHVGILDGQYHELNVLSGPKGITTRDRFDVMRCDLLLVSFIGAERVSIGTVMEIAWADMLRKPIVVAMEEDNLHRHEMLTTAAGFVVETLEEALMLASAILLP